MEHIFDFEGEKNIIGVIAPIPPTNPILAAVKIRQLANDRQGKKNILFQISPDPSGSAGTRSTRSQRIGSASL